MFEQGMLLLVGEAFLETLFMTLVSTFFAYVIGLPLGMLLVVSDKNGIYPIVSLNKIFGVIINFIRSVPFLILLVAIMPITKIVVGTVIGPKAASLALLVAAGPFVARLVESSLLEVDHGVVEAAQSMGATTWQIVSKVLVPEALPSLINGSAVSAITILGYSAMAGAVGGGGLGKLAIMYGYNRYQTDIMIITVVLLIVIVQVFQSIGNWATRKCDKRGE